MILFHDFSYCFLQEMVKIITTKMDMNGFYTAESVRRAWKDWDFGQKKEPSRWITFLVYRILKRLEENTRQTSKKINQNIVKH